MEDEMTSEVAALRQQIAAEYESAAIGLHGLASVARHEFITAKYHRMSELHEQLVDHVGEDEAIAIVAEITEISVTKETDMHIVDTPLTPPPAVIKEVSPRTAEEMLYDALDVMQLLEAGFPVSQSWIEKRDALVEEAKRLFAPEDELLVSTATQEPPVHTQEASGGQPS